MVSAPSGVNYEDNNAAPVASLLVVSGPDEGLEVVLYAGQTQIIGRTEEATIQLKDRRLSRQHCAIECKNTGVIIRDLGSRNGTYVNGEPTAVRSLKDGDKITIRETMLLFSDFSNPGPRMLLAGKPA